MFELTWQQWFIVGLCGEFEEARGALGAETKPCEEKPEAIQNKVKQLLFNCCSVEFFPVARGQPKRAHSIQKVSPHNSFSSIFFFACILMDDII